jgi:GAF domain-containing protein
MARVPLLRDGIVFGRILAGRPQVGAFDDRQMNLLQAFANQAAIAIENARLFNETGAERQTATGDILAIINQSPSDVTPLFDAIAERARVLCGTLLGATTPVP